jgi:hypothetical protein
MMSSRGRIGGYIGSHGPGSLVAEFVGETVVDGVS